MWPEKDRIRHYFVTTLRRATNLIHNTIQKIGSDPSLDEVIQLLDARHGLHKAYINMEDELDDFINFDTVFIDSPGFYTKLIAFLVRHTIRTAENSGFLSHIYLFSAFFCPRNRKRTCKSRFLLCYVQYCWELVWTQLCVRSQKAAAELRLRLFFLHKNVKV